jgi:hypothetical protein
MTAAWAPNPFVLYEQTTFSAPFESHPVTRNHAPTRSQKLITNSFTTNNHHRSRLKKHES